MRRLPFLGAALLTSIATHAGAQQFDASPRAELRVDAIVADSVTAVQGGIGVQIPAGYYARIGIDGALGADITNGHSELSGRLDLLARFLFDPFRQSRWALSGGGGVSLRAREGSNVRPYLVAVLDLEGPRSSSGVAPAFQLGLGGGVRMGVILRWASKSVR
jgi:hypothetical protein